MEKIERGKKFLSSQVRILHTTPHHDDIMLSYFPLLKKMKSCPQRVLCVTSGTNSVREKFLQELLQRDVSAQKAEKESYCHLLEEFLQAYLGADEKKLQEVESLLLRRKIYEFGKEAYQQIPAMIECIEEKRPHPLLQHVKAFVRETEEDRLWKLVDVSHEEVVHMRSKFYQDFTKVAEDIERLSQEITEYFPDVITVAMDPFQTGPETHHKVLQVLFHALKKVKTQKEIQILGYRNVWSKFTLEEATLYFPVQEEDFTEQSKAFHACYSSQYDPLFPSPEYAGPFSQLAEKIQREHSENLKQLLGADVFREYVGKAEGLIILKEMNKQEFSNYAVEMAKRHPWKIKDS